MTNKQFEYTDIQHYSEIMYDLEFYPAEKKKKFAKEATVLTSPE